MSALTVRGVRIGADRPKTIVPIVEQGEEAVLARAAEFAAKRVDCIEWRADWLREAPDPAAVARCLRGLRKTLGEKLLLVTFRTKAEGGEKVLSQSEYAAFCRMVCASGCADLLDMELYTAGDMLSSLIAEAHAAGARVVCSSHDFAQTPPQEKMVARMVEMQRAGADIAKLAVMPRSRADVLALLAATAEMADKHPETPVITMSMGPLGAVSRLCGEALGSAMTFACAGKASAPGQLELDVLNEALDSLRLPKRRVYIDCNDFHGLALFSDDTETELVLAGAKIEAMPASCKNAEYERFAREYDIHFLFEDAMPALDFYTIPYVCVWAADSAGGFFGTVDGLPDLEDSSAPVYYISKEKICFRVADTFKAFVDSPAGWQARLTEANDIALYASREKAEAANEFLPHSAVPCEAKSDGPTSVILHKTDV